MPLAKRIPENEWLRHKLAIRAMYLDQKMSLHDLTLELAKENFFPTENQVETKLKAWGFHKRVPKRLGELTWRYIDHMITKRKSEGKSTEVILFDEVVRPEKVETEARRYRAFRHGFASGQSPDSLIVDGNMRHTPLQIAARISSTNLMSMLLDNGANIDLSIGSIRGFSKVEPGCPDSEQWLWKLPALPLAVYSANSEDDLQAVSLLLASGANVLTRCKKPRGFLSSESVFTIAASHRNEHFAVQLTKNLLQVASSKQEWLRASVPDIIIAAASRGNFEVIKLLHGHNFDVTQPNEFGLTGLHAAAYEGHVDCCTQLLDLGINVDPHEPGLPPAIYLACFHNKFEVVKVLHQRGARLDRSLVISGEKMDLVTKRYFVGLHPIAYQKTFGKLPPLQTPLEVLFSPKAEMGCACERFPEYPQPPFHPWYRPKSVTQLVLYLLELGVQLPADALFWAACHWDSDILSIALEKGADPNTTILDVYSNKPRSILQLSLYSAHIQTHNRSSQTESQVRIVAMLLNAGARLTQEDALEIARFSNNDLNERILERHSFEALEIQISGGDYHISSFSGTNPHMLGFGKTDAVFRTSEELCTSVLTVCKDGLDSDVLVALLSNLNTPVPVEDSAETLMTALGIACCYENSKIVQSILKSLPISSFAYLPGDFFEILAVVGTDERRPLRQMIENTRLQRKKPFWYGIRKKASVLSYAIEAGPEFVRWLLDHGCQFDWLTVFLIACSDKAELFMNFLPCQQILPHWRANLSLCLSVSIAKRNMDLFRILINNFANILADERKRGDNYEPLRTAIELGNTEAFELLLAAGFDPKAPAYGDSKYWGVSALQAAAIFGRTGMAKQLIDLGADIDACGAAHCGRTALEGAAEHGRIELIELLLYNGVKTTGSGQLQYIRAIGFAEREGNDVVANMLRNHRSLTDEEETMLGNRELLRECSEQCFEDQLYDSGVYEDDSSECSSTTHNPQAQILDPTLLETYSNHVENSGTVFMANGNVRVETEREFFESAPSVGIYDFDEPLFGSSDAASFGLCP
ncbi:Ankyrin-3 [Paramyrothecium foliicola]|nr:Ankyrin-3 [Paramyrothecium foliicola]